MKIAILGCGAAGSVFAGYLKSGGADDIWLIDLNKAHMDKVASEGLVFRTPDGETRLKGFRTAYSAQEVGICDIVIIVVKATQTVDAMEGAKACIGRNTVVASLQNGLGNELTLKKYIPENRIILGCGRIGTELPEPGVCVAKPNKGITNLFIGPLEQNELTERVGKFLEEAFMAGGLEPKYFDDVRPNIWKKAIANSGFNTVCAVLRLKMKEVANDEFGIDLVKSIFREASDVASALGIGELYEGLVNDIPNTVKNLGDYYPSMAQDALVFHRQTEVSVLTGAIAEYGKEVGVATPTCDVLTKVIKAIQANYDCQYK